MCLTTAATAKKTSNSNKFVSQNNTHMNRIYSELDSEASLCNTSDNYIYSDSHNMIGKIAKKNYSKSCMRSEQRKSENMH